MLTEFHVKNFKSIRDLRLEPGRVTVLIGENGSGKSNILEALALASAAVGQRLDHEFLASRGIRTTEPRFMRSAFEANADEAVHLAFKANSISFSFSLVAENEGPYARWLEMPGEPAFDVQRNDNGRQAHFIFKFPSTLSANERANWLAHELKSRSGAGSDAELDLDKIATLLVDFAEHSRNSTTLNQFLIYSPENTALRNFEQEGQILPLGIKGEGLFQLLRELNSDEARITEIRENLRLLDWFEDIRVATDLAPFERRLGIRDRYLASDSDSLAYFDQRSSNEGFLFLLFYFALMCSSATPEMFAIDNIDASLNPKLCTELMRRLVALAVKHDKQVLITTHNPAVLDGLDLNDDQQRLYTVYRNTKGHTRARRVLPPKPIAGEPPIKLSEAFLRGLLGGLPQNF